MRRSSSKLLYALVMAPGILYILIGRIIPLIYTLYMSLHSWNLISVAKPHFVGLSNYLDLMNNARFLGSVAFTFKFTLIAVAVELLLGLGLALMVDAVKRGRNLLQAVFLVPMFIAPVAVGTIWYILFNATIGPINHLLLRSLGIPPVNWLDTNASAFMAIVVTDAWQWTPFTFLLLFASLQTIEPEVYEAAKVDGASGFRLFSHITFPLILTTAITAAVLRATDAFRIFDTIFVLTGGGPGSSTESAGIFIYKTGFQYYRMDQAGAMTIALLFVLAVAYYVIRKLGGGRA